MEVGLRSTYKKPNSLRGLQLVKTMVDVDAQVLLCMGETCLILTLQFQIAGAGATSWTLRETGLRHLLR